MSQDAWAAADAASRGATANGDGQSQLADGYQPAASQLFSGGDGAGPSLMNQTHAVGTERSGTIVKAPYDRHSTNMAGKLKYWQDGQNKPVLEAVNPTTGQPNRKVWDTVIVLDTDYVMSAEEAKTIGREAPFEGGRRCVILAGADLKAFKKAMEDAATRGIRLTSDADFEGLKLTVNRVSEKPNPNGGHSIKEHAFRLDRAS